MQQELQRRAQQEQKKHIQDSSYNQINNFLSGLEVEEKEDQVNKSHLFINHEQDIKILYLQRIKNLK